MSEINIGKDLLLWVDYVPQNSYFEDMIPSSLEYNFVWRENFYSSKLES